MDRNYNAYIKLLVASDFQGARKITCRMIARLELDEHKSDLGTFDVEKWYTLEQTSWDCIIAARKAKEHE